MMNKLSLIIPVYGVENYIHVFLDSLTPNLITGIEVIFVDDGSKDLSGQIITDYAKLHGDFVKVIHKENGGVSSARNKGLEMAKGEYVIFPDPDDYLHPNYVEEILSAIEKYNKPDIVFLITTLVLVKRILKRILFLALKKDLFQRKSFFVNILKMIALKEWYGVKPLRGLFMMDCLLMLIQG